MITMKKLFTLLLALTALFSLSACGQKGLTIALPNDPTNEGRALLLLEAKGLIKLKESAGLTATLQDILENPYHISFKEAEAAQLPNLLKDVDFAVINTNYALAAGLNPGRDALYMEGAVSPYVNILCVKEGRQNDPLVKALAAALTSHQVVEHIREKYDGQIVAAVEKESNGFDPSLDYGALAGKSISVAASPSPHVDILEVAKAILAEKNISLEIKSFEDYVLPNTVVEDGEIDANYFQHLPYLNEFNDSRGTHLVSVAGIHIEPMSLYGGKQSSLDVFK